MAIGAAGVDETTMSTLAPVGPLTSFTVRSSLTEFVRGDPGDPAYSVAVPAPRTAFRQSAGIVDVPSIAARLHDGKYRAFDLIADAKKIVCEGLVSGCCPGGVVSTC